MYGTNVGNLTHHIITVVIKQHNNNNIPFFFCCSSWPQPKIGCRRAFFFFQPWLANGQTWLTIPTTPTIMHVHGRITGIRTIQYRRMRLGGLATHLSQKTRQANGPRLTWTVPTKKTTTNLRHTSRCLPLMLSIACLFQQQSPTSLEKAHCTN